MAYLDLRSLCLIISMLRVGRGADRRLVGYSHRFTLNEPHRRHAARTGSFSGFCLSLRYRIPCGLFTPGSFYPVVFANGLVLGNLAKWRDFHYSQIFFSNCDISRIYI